MRKQPNRVKFRKVSKGGIQKGYVDIKFNNGICSMVSIEYARVTARQLEATRRTIRHVLKRKGIVWIDVFPLKGITAKPTEVRMGKGTGSVSYWATRVRPGTTLFSVSGVDETTAISALLAGGKKIPMCVKCIMRDICIS